jgi:ADP-heptose:LPS heptosyltransferase
MHSKVPGSMISTPARDAHPPGDPGSIGVLRALQLGDMLCSVPALRALRGRFPRARITLIGLPWARAFASRFNGYLDGFLEFPGFPGLPERQASPRGFDRFLREAAALRLDLALQMHGDGSITNGILAMLGARRMAGFRGPDAQAVPPGMEATPWPGQGSEIRRLLALTSFLGAPARGENLEWPVCAEDVAELKALPGAGGLRAGAYVCVHPGARSATRRWPVERFADVADRLAAMGFPAVLTGSEEERALTGSLAQHMTSRALDLGGRLSLGALGALLSDARLLISNDTGVSHLAAALGVPSVVVFNTSDATRWAPLDRARHRCVLPAVAGGRCDHPGCPPQRPCARSIAAEPVWREARELLESA